MLCRRIIDGMTQVVALAPASTLGQRLTQSRGFAQLSQDEIGEQVGATRRTIHAWERNQTSPTVEKLLRWARATGFPAVWFIEGLDDSWAPRGSNPRPMDYVPGQLEFPALALAS